MKTSVLLLSLVLLVPALAAQGNDDCAGAIVVNYGANGPFSNAGATESGVLASCGALGSPGYHDVWFLFTPACTEVLTIDTGCFGFDTVVSLYDACSGAEIACNDDSPVCGLSSAVSFSATLNVPRLIRVASWASGTTGSFLLNITVTGGFQLSFSTGWGPGTLQVDAKGGPFYGGTYFLAVTFGAGGFPSGWFFGVDLSLAELNNLLNTGYPFVGPLDYCGGMTIGPIFGIGAISGIPFYAVILGIPPGGFYPTHVSLPVTGTVL